MSQFTKHFESFLPPYLPISSATDKAKVSSNFTWPKTIQEVTERAEPVLVALNKLCLHENEKPLWPHLCVLSLACSHAHGSSVPCIALTVCSLEVGGSWPHSHRTTELHFPLVSLDYTEISDDATGASIEASSHIRLVLISATAWVLMWHSSQSRKLPRGSGSWRSEC